MGVIPEESVTEFMVGRIKEKKELEIYLQEILEGEGKVKFIKGAYGSGKTFLMKYLSEIALTNKFIVANVPVHSGFGFGKLDDIYTNIMNHLLVKHGKEKSASFEMIFDQWLSGLKASGDMTRATQSIYKVIQVLGDYNGSFASVLLTYIRALINHDYELARIAASWIKGDKNLSYQLKKKLKVKGSIDRDNALDIFKAFVRMIRLLGYAGILITFDEAELMMQQRTDIRMKAYSNIRQLMDLTGSGELSYIGFVFAGTEQFFEDKDKGLKSYPAIDQRIGQKIQGNRGIENVRQPIMPLDIFEKEDYTELSRKICSLHEGSYDYQLEVSLDQLINLTMLECNKQSSSGSLSIRIYLKKFIELLDLMMDNPELPIFKAIRNQYQRH